MGFFTPMVVIIITLSSAGLLITDRVSELLTFTSPNPNHQNTNHEIPTSTLAFIQCLTHHVGPNHHDLVYIPRTEPYKELLLSSLHNAVFLNYTTTNSSMPALIVAASDEAQVKASVICGKEIGLKLRVRSGGHDLEGLSYRSVQSNRPFFTLDLNRFRSVRIDPERKEAWVESGATIGELYYNIGKASPILGFPAGHTPSVGVGGHVTGGGIGTMVRKYGLASDNIIDCRLVDVEGRVLDRESMGEELFWAVRGGGGASFGVILSYKLRLVDVPPKVTVFAKSVPDGDGTMGLVHRWQEVAYKLPREVDISVNLKSQENRTMGVKFRSLFLGEKEELLRIVSDGFPELGLVGEDCKEMSWVESVLYLFHSGDWDTTESIEELLDRKGNMDLGCKGKYDFVDQQMNITRWKEVWEKILDTTGVYLELGPSGGIMYEIPETETAFPHRSNVFFKVLYVRSINGEGVEGREQVESVRHFYNSLEPYVSKGTRRAYINIKDLDLGMNSVDGEGDYSESLVWGEKYFRGNFKKLAVVKGSVDPENYFWNEQSVPPLFL